MPDTKEGSRGGAQEQGAAWLKVGKRYAVVLKPAVDRIDEREDLMEVQVRAQLCQANSCGRVPVKHVVVLRAVS